MMRKILFALVLIAASAEHTNAMMSKLTPMSNGSKDGQAMPSEPVVSKKDVRKQRKEERKEKRLTKKENRREKKI